MELEGEPREAAASALRSSRRMRRLVADLLLLARADAGRVAAARAGRPLRGASPRRPASSSRSPATTRSASPPPPGAEVEGARDELHRLTLNLLENALRHTDPGHGGRGDGGAASTARSCSPSRTTGPGIPPELHDKVFERFFRGAGDRSGSSGLGLVDRARRRAVARRHGARWRSRSTGAAPASWCASPRAADRSVRVDTPAAQAAVPLPIPGSHRPSACKGAPMSDTTTSQQLVVFSLGAEEYALPIAAVHEIIRFTEPRSVASEVAWIRGVIGLRGKIIPIFDLAARLGARRHRHRAGQDRDRRDRHRPGRRHGRRGRGGPDGRAPTSSSPSRPPTPTRSRRSPRSTTAW